MNNFESTPHATDKLAWQADRLLLDALTPAEQAEFAELLATDQAAREALAQEVLLLQSLSQLSAADFAPRELVTPAAKRFHWTRIASGVLAASLLLAAVISSQSDLFPGANATNPLANRTGHVAREAELASLWSQNRAAYVSVMSEVGGSDSLLEAELDSRPRDERDTESEMAPDWMFAALEAEQANPAAAADAEDIQWQ